MESGGGGKFLNGFINTSPGPHHHHALLRATMDLQAQPLVWVRSYKCRDLCVRRRCRTKASKPKSYEDFGEQRGSTSCRCRRRSHKRCTRCLTDMPHYKQVGVGQSRRKTCFSTLRVEKALLYIRVASLRKSPSHVIADIFPAISAIHFFLLSTCSRTQRYDEETTSEVVCSTAVRRADSSTVHTGLSPNDVCRGTPTQLPHGGGRVMRVR